tara:strand:+ start:3554 stop:4870 length:1317 start_codon:yes stop_codon:yes gene_type:complete
MAEFRILDQITHTAIVKFFSSIFGFINVGLLIYILGEKNYGFWIVLTSVGVWLTLFQFGIGSGVRNKLSEFLIKKDEIKISKIISTGFIAIFFILFLVLLIIFFFLNENLLNLLFPLNIYENKSYLVKLILISISVTIIGSYFNSILASYHYSEISSYSFLLQQAIITIASTILVKNIIIFEDNLLYVTYSYLFASIFGYLFLPVSFLIKSLNQKIYFVGFDSKIFQSIFGVSLNFLMLSIFSILLYFTDHFFINFYLGGTSLSAYSVSQKYFGIILIIASTIAGPIWASVKSSNLLHDKNKLQIILRRLLLSSVALLIVVFFLFVFFDFVIFYWIGQLTSISEELVLYMAILTSINAINLVTANIINGYGYLRIQIICGGFAALSNVLFTFIGLQFFSQGTEYVILVSIFSLIPSLFFTITQVNFLFRGNAYGIWKS